MEKTNHGLHQLSSTGIKVTPLGFGTWPLGDIGRPAENQGIQIIISAIELGINFIDTADAYCLDETEKGYAERLVAKALKKMKNFSRGNNTSDPFVATKVGCTRPNGSWGVNGRPEYIKRACDHSLKALEVERIDLYQLHTVDPSVPLKETIEALDLLKKEGKVRFLGLSNVEVSEIKTARKITEIISVQNQCNIFDLSSFKNGVVAYCEEQNLSFIPYSPLGGQLEKGRTAKNVTLNKIAKVLSGQHNFQVTPFQVALSWLLAKSPKILPIPATTSLEHLKSNIKALEINLTHEQIKEIDKAVGFG